MLGAVVVRAYDDEAVCDVCIGPRALVSTSALLLLIEGLLINGKVVIAALHSLDHFSGGYCSRVHHLEHGSAVMVVIVAVSPPDLDEGSENVAEAKQSASDRDAATHGVDITLDRTKQSRITSWCRTAHRFSSVAAAH